ncbi:hypothetical protein MHTCC0001_20000 [Flavobacteriaceae bacterium MHTCC 0001]
MSTRPIVEAAIAAIEDNGNNTAVEVRDVLTKLLDYTENDAPPQQQVNFFNPFFTEGPIEDGRTGSELQYSCRGFTDAFAHFTFQLKISDNSDGNIFTFPLQEDHAQEMLEVIEKILPTKAMYFSIPFRVRLGDQDNTFAFAIPTNISFDLQRITTGGTQTEIPFVRFDMDFTVVSGQGQPDFQLTNALAYTSICFHSNERIIEDTI